MSPKVTVLMPVYNGEKYLKEAVESILNQTYQDFEFLIINDGSTDKSVEIIESYDDPRIRLVHNDGNIKLIASLNKGLGMAVGKYIARMDCDDISLPERLSKQVALMDSRPEIGVCGTWVKTFGDINGDIWKYPTDSDRIKCRLLFESVLAHPSVMMRSDLFKKHNLRYSYDYPHAEDFQLWQRASLIFPLVNMPEVLVLYRITVNSVSRFNKDAKLESLRRIDSEALSQLDIYANPSEINLHRRLALFDFEHTRDFVEEVNNWLLKLLVANRKIKRFPNHIFEQVLGERWYAVCYAARELGMWTWRKFWGSELGKTTKLSWLQKINLLVKCRVRFAY
ncbi:MAG: hypothetical protein A2W23_03675 [Planctomycetes bacterium RBG_16_43_13]|nr:MAG: hypothetical protein A2W23_03675 [Planctomycetes bacterium RBG_16_43_13]